MRPGRSRSGPLRSARLFELVALGSLLAEAGFAGWGAATSGLPRLASDRSPVAARSARYARELLAQDWARYAASAPDGRAIAAARPHL
jgi:hypothetical protein